MNRILPEMPTLNAEHFAVYMPKWLTVLLRVVSVVFAVAFAMLAFDDWNKIPWVFRGLLCVLVPVFLLQGIHPKGWGMWSAQPFFMADRRGMYFMSTLGRTAFVSKKQAVKWLFVPWENIANIRVATVRDSEGKSSGAVFDIKATQEQVDEFLYKEDIVDKSPVPEGFVSVPFYVNGVPSRRKVVADLLEFRRLNDA